MAINVAEDAVLSAPASEHNGVSDDLGVAKEVLEPLLEGARARGIADAFEMMGQAAVFIDCSGSVLHYSSDAGRLLGNGVCLAGGHLVGADAESNRELSRLIGAALDETGAKCAESEINTESGLLKVRAISFRGGRGNLFQLLKAVILIDPVRAAGQGSC